MGAMPSYSVRAAAERVGVPTATLRSWNRRYGVGPTEHHPGRHRRYSEADIAVLQRMHELIGQGVNPRSAAQTVAGTAVPDAGPAALLSAAFALDIVAAGRIIESCLRLRGVPDTWERVILPAFAEIDARQRAEGGCIDVEHALSWTVTRALQALPIGATGPPTILACPTAENHTLALEALRAALSEHGRDTLMLGASVPTPALLDAIAARSKDVRVVLWAQSPATADVEAVSAVLAAGASAFVAGPGWTAADSRALPDQAVHLSSLSAAMRYLDSVLN